MVNKAGIHVFMGHDSLEYATYAMPLSGKIIKKKNYVWEGLSM